MDELRQGNRGAESTKGRRLRESLVVAQVALALILMTQVGLIGRTTWRLHYLDKGFDPTQVLTLRMNLAEADYRDLAVAHDFYTRALERIQALPGVTSAGTVTALPIADREVSVRFSIQGRPAPSPESQPQAARAGISADYLKTMRVPIVRGRGFVQADFGNAPPVALVTRETARRYWRDEDPIGRRIAFAGDEHVWIEVVGVVGDVRNSNAGSGPTPQVYVPSSWRPERSTVFVVRNTGKDPTQIAPTIRSELAQLDKTQPVYDVRSMQRVLVEDLGGTYLVHWHARRVCHRGAAARRCRRVRPRLVFGKPAHARDWASHGARSTTRGNPRNGRYPWKRADDHRARSWIGGSGGAACR